MPEKLGNNHYECRKCGSRFEEPQPVIHTTSDAYHITYHVCPICKSRDFEEIKCAYCDFFKSRLFPCGKGYKTIVPHSVACWEWKIRSKNKPKVI